MKKQFLLALICIIGTFSISAQSTYYNYGQDNFLRAEFNKPIFSDDNISVNFLTFDAYLNGEFTVGTKNKIAFELPYSRFSFDAGQGNNLNVSGIGNIAVGYQIRDLDSPDYFELKFRLPTASEDDIFPILFSSDYTERFNAFFPDLMSIEGSYNLESTNNVGLYYRFRPGVKLLIATADDLIDDGTELLLDLNLVGGYRTTDFDINAGITTTSIITESDIDLDERVLRQAYTTFTYTAGAVKPGLIIRKPMGDFNGGVTDLSIGIHIGYTFGSKSEQTMDEMESK